MLVAQFTFKVTNDALLAPGDLFFIFFAVCIASFFYVLLLVPETAGVKAEDVMDQISLYGEWELALRTRIGNWVCGSSRGAATAPSGGGGGGSDAGILGREQFRYMMMLCFMCLCVL